ncbi:GatB/YqeY domain-containing protein [Piedraia hortae CBS 480.64]|uniref:Altered inheritance of mitochondria protein 41 n=1 Tax=Piedraia hortae CBS 480.64 TaxID=1314780 RepID=A0A6A7CB90_9PEZI|nr:GatB/YqeY domain-containing protein [Piedraia hortae CBS 480.64]
MASRALYIQRLALPRCVLQSPRLQTGLFHHGFLRYNSTTSEATPIFQAIRTDLKSAMKAKNSVQLGVLRSLLSEINNSHHGPNPITTHAQVLRMLQKKITAAQEAREEFVQAGRKDLQAKEEEQIAILKSYVDTYRGEEVNWDDLKKIVTSLVKEVKELDSKGASMGEVLKRLMKKVEGSDVDRGQLAKLVKELWPGK